MAHILLAQIASLNSVIGEESISCVNDRGRETTFGKSESTFAHFAPQRAHSFEFEELMAVRGKELQSFHLRPALRPVFLILEKVHSPIAGAKVRKILKTAAHRWLGSHETHRAPSRGGIFCAQTLRVEFAAANGSNAFLRHSCSHKRLSHRQKCRAAAAGPF